MLLFYCIFVDWLAFFATHLARSCLAFLSAVFDLLFRCAAASTVADGDGEYCADRFLLFVSVFLLVAVVAAAAVANAAIDAVAAAIVADVRRKEANKERKKKKQTTKPETKKPRKK